MNKFFFLFPLLFFLVLMPVSGEDVGAFIDVGATLYEDGLYRDALAVYDKAIRLDGTDPVLYEKKAECLLKLNRYNEALNAINMAISLDESSESVKTLKDEITLKLKSMQESQTLTRDKQDTRKNSSDSKLESESYDNTAGNEKVSIQTSEEIIVRGTPFFINITGEPNAEYYLWVKGTNSMSGDPGDQPPMILELQDDISQDDIAGPYEIGNYQYKGGAGKSIRNDVPDDPDYHGTKCYASVKLNSSGTQTVEFKTTKDTKDISYIIHIERKSGNQYQSDEVNIQIKKGDITCVGDRCADILENEDNGNFYPENLTGKALPPPTATPLL